MTKSPDDKAGAELLARQLNARLAAEGLGIKAQKDRRALAREARVEAAARRQMFEMRRRPGYVAGEAREPFQAEVRLIRATDHLDATGAETSEPEARPTFSEMREMRDEYPNIPATVIEHRRRKTAALNKIKEGTKKK